MTPAQAQALDNWIAAKAAYFAAGGMGIKDEALYRTLDNAAYAAMKAFVRLGGSADMLHEAGMEHFPKHYGVSA